MFLPIALWYTGPQCGVGNKFCILFMLQLHCTRFGSIIVVLFVQACPIRLPVDRSSPLTYRLVDSCFLFGFIFAWLSWLFRLNWIVEIYTAVTCIYKVSTLYQLIISLFIYRSVSLIFMLCVLFLQLVREKKRSLTTGFPFHYYHFGLNIFKR